MSMTQQASDAREQLLNDLRTVIQEAEQLLSETEQQTEHGYKTAIAQFERKLRKTKRELVRVEQRLASSGVQAIQATDRFVENNPWQAASIGLCAGLLAGLMISRK